jgi:hypothetical protein
MIRKRYGLEAAQVALGHAKASMTELYAEKNLALPSKSRPSADRMKERERRSSYPATARPAVP